MTAEDDRARQYRENQRRIAAKRRAAALRLLAPPAPLKALKEAYKPLRDWRAERPDGPAGGGPC